MTDKIYYAVIYGYIRDTYKELTYVRETQTQLVLKDSRNEMKFNKKTGREVTGRRDSTRKWGLITRDEYLKNIKQQKIKSLEIAEENIEKYEECLELYKSKKQNLLQEIEKLDKELEKDGSTY